MPTEQIISLLIAERDRLNRAIEELQGSAGRGAAKSANSAPAASSGGARRGRRKPMTAAERKAHSERMKAYWAERRKNQKA